MFRLLCLNNNYFFRSNELIGFGSNGSSISLVLRIDSQLKVSDSFKIESWTKDKTKQNINILFRVISFFTLCFLKYECSFHLKSNGYDLEERNRYSPCEVHSKVMTEHRSKIEKFISLILEQHCKICA